MENAHNEVLPALEGAFDFVLLMPSSVIWGWREQVRESERLDLVGRRPDLAVQQLLTLLLLNNVVN